jgi:hypothetical protein
MKSLQRQIALETRRALTATEDNHFADRSMKGSQRRHHLSNAPIEHPEPAIALPGTDLCNGDDFNEASSKAMISSPPRSSRHVEREKRLPNATAQAQTSFALSFTQDSNGKSRSAASKMQFAQSSSAASPSNTMPQNVNITLQVPCNQQIDFVETRTTPDGAFVMKWSYRPAQVESHPRLASSAADHGIPNGLERSSARENVINPESAPVRSRKFATRSKVPKSVISSADQRPYEYRDDRAHNHVTSETSHAGRSRLDLDTAAADDREKGLTLQARSQRNPPGDVIRRKFSLRNLLTPPPSIADHSVPASPQRITQEDVLSARYRNASDRMEKAITSFQRDLLREITSSSNKLAVKVNLPLSGSQERSSRPEAENPIRAATSPGRQPTPHPDLGKMLNNGRTSHAGRSHKHLQTTNRSLRPARSFRNDPWLDAAAPISPGKENRSPNSRAEK